MTFTRSLIAAAAIATAPLAALAEAATYTLDPSHSQALFSYTHMGFSTTWGMFSGFEGTIAFDEGNPAASSVEVSIPTSALITGWDARTQHFLGGDFFNAASNDMVKFKSTGIEVTGERTAKITGDLTINGVTQPVVLDTVMNKAGDHPMKGTPFVGFSATTSIKRSDFNMGKFAPAVSDEVELEISIEAEGA